MCMRTYVLKVPTQQMYRCCAESTAVYDCERARHPDKTTEKLLRDRKQSWLVAKCTRGAQPLV